MGNEYQIEREMVEPRSVAELAEDVEFRLPGCSEVLVRKSLRTAYRDFCRLTQCYRTVRRAAPCPGTAAEAWTYPVIPQIPGCQVDAVSSVTVNGVRLKDSEWEARVFPLFTVSIRRMPERFAKCRCALHAGPHHGRDPWRWPHGPLHPDPCGWDKVDIEVVEVPRFDSESAPAWFLDRFADAVISGALAKLFAMQGRPWTDPAQCQQETVRWENFCTVAKLNSLTKGQLGDCETDMVDMGGVL